MSPRSVEDLIAEEDAAAEREAVVRVRHKDEGPPRCHYCGHADWDLVSETVGEDRWAVFRKRHPRTGLGSSGRSTCPPMPDGWTTCYRCDRGIAPEEQRRVTLRMDRTIGRLREEAMLTVEPAVEQTTTEREWAPNVRPQGRHSHRWDGAEVAYGFEESDSAWVAGERPYEGPSVEGCRNCGSYERYTTTEVVKEAVVVSEWAEIVMDFDNGETVAYTDYYPAVEKVRCHVGGCVSTKHDEHARGEPTTEDIADVMAAEAEDEGAPESDAAQTSVDPRVREDGMVAMVPESDPGVVIEQLAALWGLKLRQTRTYARRFTVEGRLRMIHPDPKSTRAHYVRATDPEAPE